MRFLERRDQDFDVVKTFLVISMTIAHGFQWFYYQGYNRNLTYYVLLGFVYLSGITIGSVYREKLLLHPNRYSWPVLIRCSKLIGIFILSNTLLILLHLNKQQIPEFRLTDLLLSALLNCGQIRFSFEVLVPISLTFLGSIAILMWKNRYMDLLLLILGICTLWAIEITGELDYKGIKMLIVGLIGVLSAKLLYLVNWDEQKVFLSRRVLIIWILYLTYQTALMIVGDYFLVRHYINVTVILLLAVYLTSIRFDLNNYRIMRLLNQALAKHMLFAYLFHIFVIAMLSKFIGRRNLEVDYTIAVVFLVQAITILGGLAIDFLTGKNREINRLYSLIFR